MLTPETYAAWKARKQQLAAGMANIILAQPFASEPDQYAADVGFAREASNATGTSVPLSLVQDPNTRSVFDQIVAEKKRSTVLTQSPRLSEWLRTPGNAEVARDNLEGMSWWEATGNLFNRAMARAGEVTASKGLTQFAQTSQDAGKSYNEILDTLSAVDPRQQQLAERLGVPASKVQPSVSVGDMLQAGQRMFNANVTTLLGADPDQIARDYAQGVTKAKEWLEANPAPSSRFAEMAFAGDGFDAGQAVQNFAGAAVSDPIGMLTWAANVVGENAVALAPGLLVGAVTANPAAGAAVAFGSSYDVEKALSAVEYFSEQGVDLSTSEGVGRLLSDPALLREAAARGHTRGLIIGAFEAMGIGLLGRSILSNPVADAALQAVNQAILGSTGEAAARAASGQSMDWNEILAEGLAGVATLPIDLGVAGRRIAIDTGRAEQANAHAETMTEMATRAAADPVRNRMPDAFRDYLRNATANTGAENLYVPAEQFVEYFQSSGIDPFELADKLTGMSRQDVQTAIDTGGAVKIPTATWAADMAGSEHDQFVINNSTFAPDAMTPVEAAEFNARAQEALQEAWDEAERIRIEADSLRQTYEIERETLVSSLRAAGRAADVAETEALPMLEFRRVMAERMGYTPEEFAARYPLPRIEGTRPEGLDPKNVDALTRTLAEARAQRSVGVAPLQTPLLEFIAERGGIDDPGGELAARDAATIKRPGKKTLKLARGAMAAMRSMFGFSGADYGMDSVARAAVESGFMADDPDVLAWQEAQRNGTEAPDLQPALLRAIEAEVRGEVPITADDGLAGVEEYLAGLGLSLEDSDADIRAALDSDGRQYGQAARVRDGLRALWDFARNGPGNKTHTVDMAPVTEAVASAIQMSTGQDVTGFRHSIDAFAIRHIMKEHGDARGEASRGQLPVTEQDIVDLPNLLAAATEVATGVKGRRGQDIVALLTRLPDGTTVVIEEVRTGRKRLSLLSMRKYPPAIKSDAIVAGLDPNAQNVPGGGVNVVQVEPDAKGTSYNQADAGFSGGGRGSIQFPAGGVSNGETLVSLFQRADLSTFLHESGHYFLTVMRDAAGLDPEGPIAREFETVKAWWRDNADAVARDAGNGVTADDVRAAIDTGTSGDAAKDLAIDTGMQEQFARGIEAYMLEGKAPSPSLRQAFEKFRAWLVSIYRTMRNLNVNVTDELRGVFDRMLATDHEIAEARTDLGADVQLTAADLGMTDEQFQGFLRLRDQAKADASAKLLAETMAPIRRAKTAEYKAVRKQVRDRIEREAKQQPVYKAIQELRFGKDFDGNDVEPLKLNRALIESSYGAGYIGFLPGATKDGAGHRNAVFSTEGGVHPDIAAGAYGFPTGREMLDALANAPDMLDLIESETNLEMERRFSDPLKDGSVQALAMAAVHDDARGRELAMELEALNEIAGTDRGLTAKEARETARRAVRTMTMRDATRPDRFLAAERKAAAEVARLSSTVTRHKMWVDAAARRVQSSARALVRGEASPEAVARAVNDFNAQFETTQSTFTVAEQTRTSSAGREFTIPAGERTSTSLGFNEQAAALVEAKRRQLMNHALYREALAVSRDQESFIKRLGLIQKSNKRLAKTRDINFIYAARAVAGRFGLARPVATFDFSSWLEQLKFEDPITAAAMVSTIETYSQQAKPYRDLTVDEYGAVKDAIDSLLAMSKTTREIEIDGQKAVRQDAIDAMIDKAAPRVKERPGTRSAPTKREKSWLDALTTGSALVRAEAWARDMDDGDAGVFTRYIIKPVMDALGVYRAARFERLNKLLAIVEPRRGELLGTAVSAPEIGYTFENKGALLHALLHTGNESNKKKLLVGRGWSKGMVGQKQAVSHAGKPRVDRKGNPIMDKGVLDTAQWDAMIERLIADGTITAADKKMVEDIWSLMDQLKRPAQTAHKKMFGHYFQEIEAQPFTNSLGAWRGGYVPAIIDHYAAVDAGKQDAAAALDAQMDASMFPTTGSGFTKSRVEYNQPLALNLQSLPGHMDKVLRFTHLEPAIRQTSSLLTDRTLRETVSGVNRDAIDSILTPWLVRTARQSVETPAVTPFGRTMANYARELRKRVGLHMMAINVVNAAQQVTGIPTAAVLVKVKHLKGAMTRYARDGSSMATEAIEASAMMRDRMDNSSRMTAQEIDKIIVEPTIRGEVDRFVTQHGYVLQQGMQNVVDVVVWHAAYDQAIQQGKAGNDAVFEADSVVRRTQGSFNPEDVSALESGNGLARLLTMFYSYFNTQLNLIGGEALTSIRKLGWKGASPRLFSLYFLGILAPAVIAEAMAQAARGELGDEDDDGLLDDMLELFIGSQVKFVAGGVPVLGPLTVAAINKFNDQPFDDRLSASPAQYLLERAVGAPATITDAAFGDGSGSKAVADGLTTLGLLLGIPTGQLAKSIGYTLGVQEGRSQPESFLDVAKGLTSGRDGTE